MLNNPPRNYPLNGQWIGRSTGTNLGWLTADIEANENGYGGYAYLWDEIPELPGLSVVISTTGFSLSQEIVVPVFPIDLRTGYPYSPEPPRASPDTRLPTRAIVRFSLENDVLHVEAETDADTRIEANLRRTGGNQESDYEPLSAVNSWADFVTYLATLEKGRFIFRGQKKPLPLKTAFHRRGRVDLNRFLAEDRDALHRHLSSKTKHLLNPLFPEQNGALVSLAQHHGYPTPLLDWTYSPYIAAFFAYRKYSNAKARSNPNNIRIFKFDLKAWRSDFPQYWILNPMWPHVSVMHFLATNNERLIPQQSVSLATNIVDLEAYFRICEAANGKRYLEVIDLPVNLRQAVMSNLSVMGITAGSMLPGFDGICEELRERFFS